MGVVSTDVLFTVIMSASRVQVEEDSRARSVSSHRPVQGGAADLAKGAAGDSVAK